MNWRQPTIDPARKKAGALLLFWCLLVVLAVRGSELKRDEKLILYPAIASRSSSGWELSIHGIVYEPGRHALEARALRHLFGLDDEGLSVAEKGTFSERIRYFLVDNERGKKFVARFGERTSRLGTSAANGHFTAKVSLKPAEWPALDAISADTNFMLATTLLYKKHAEERFTFPVQVLNETGLSVISDIDDTIKVSDVRDRKALVRNTFCRPFKPVSGMAEVYQSWAQKAGAQFHYVTASPWQLYLPLSEFLRTNGFPAGTFQMKDFRVKDSSFLQLFLSPERYKPQVIEPLLKNFPHRQFVLVGDSGEKDPEIYASLARRHPSQIRRILIRDVSGEAAGGARYQKVFGELPVKLWRVFKDPSEIADAIQYPDPVNPKQ